MCQTNNFINRGLLIVHCAPKFIKSGRKGFQTTQIKDKSTRKCNRTALIMILTTLIKHKSAPKMILTTLLRIMTCKISNKTRKHRGK